MRYKKQLVIGRFENFVNRDGPVMSHMDTQCWVWEGAIDGGGYGILSIDCKDCKAHRVVWTLVCGPIPEGVWVLHHCDNKVCVNPGHLYLGNREDNVKDSVERGRMLSGEDNPASKFSDETVRQVRDLYDKGVATDIIAAHFDMDISYVRVLGKRLFRKGAENG